jgi:hypothetical protein
MQMDELIAAVEIGRPASDWELPFAHRAARRCYFAQAMVRLRLSDEREYRPS